MELAVANKTATRLLQDLMPHCEQAMIAGSVRRECPEVGDIEIVMVPKPYETGLFASGVAIVIEQYPAIRGALPCRYTARRVRVQSELERKEIQVDFFLTHSYDFIRQLVIRTGSADFSARVATAWRAKGWVGTKDGLRREVECVDNNGKWQIASEFESNPTMPPYWKTEQEFFSFLGIPYIEPKLRV